MKADVVIIGAGAAGLMCAIEAAKRGRSTIVLEHNGVVGEKIRISGGGRCNFTNTHVESRNFISQNPHFCKSALARYPSASFIELVERHGIRYHEKKLGQLFCDGSSQQIIDMLVNECRITGVDIQTDTEVLLVSKNNRYRVATNRDEIDCQSLVVATGGLSVPKLGASDFGYRIAQQFGLNIVPPRPGLVPLIFQTAEADSFAALSGVSLDAVVHVNRMEFRENILFTHRGLSGPAVLQSSSYWNEGQVVILNLLPDWDVTDFLSSNHYIRSQLTTVLEQVLPKRFVKRWLEQRGGSRTMNRYSLKELQNFAQELTSWKIVPAGTEGFGKAEVTVGGVDTDELSSKTMEAKKSKGLYFIGEVVDVTGWLGGFNFQWAWSSGWVAGQFV